MNKSNEKYSSTHVSSSVQSLSYILVLSLNLFPDGRGLCSPERRFSGSGRIPGAFFMTASSYRTCIDSKLLHLQPHKTKKLYLSWNHRRNTVSAGVSRTGFQHVFSNRADGPCTVHLQRFVWGDRLNFFCFGGIRPQNVVFTCSTTAHTHTHHLNIG